MKDKVHDAAPGATKWYLEDTGYLGPGLPDALPKATDAVPGGRAHEGVAPTVRGGSASPRGGGDRDAEHRRGQRQEQAAQPSTTVGRREGRSPAQSRRRIRGATTKSCSPVASRIGISGASQHLAGIGGAKAVVAANTDPDAPIFSTARFGVVMDCHTFVASMLERLRGAQ